VFGFDLSSEREEIRCLVELLGHRTRLYEDLSARENLLFSCRLFDLSGKEIPAILEWVGLTESADERVRGYSQGMRQRVALARALLRRPALLLLDEPYAGLDAEAKDLVDLALVEAQRDGRTAVVATHDPTRGSMASRVVHMDGGRLLSGVPAPSDAQGVAP
jgi:heme exporter protein A